MNNLNPLYESKVGKGVEGLSAMTRIGRWLAREKPGAATGTVIGGAVGSIGGPAGTALGAVTGLGTGAGLNELIATELRLRGVIKHLEAKGWSPKKIDTYLKRMMPNL